MQELEAAEEKYPVKFGKNKTYYDVQFPVDGLMECYAIFLNGIRNRGFELSRNIATFGRTEQSIVENANDTYLRRAFEANYFKLLVFAEKQSGFMALNYDRSIFYISVEDMKDLDLADEIIRFMDKYYESSKLPEREILKDVTVFVGHGRSRLWRDLKDHLHDHHQIEVVAYETGSRAGYTIQEVLKEMSSRASIAFLVHTAEDIDREGMAHARENVIHETGLFQGILGLRRAIVVLEDGTNEFSNIAGLQQIRFQKGNIKEIFGDVLAVIRREFAPKK